MATRAEPKHSWDMNFWPNVEPMESEWTTSCPMENRRSFELAIEGMIRRSIPNDLERLLAHYQACNWTDRPDNADSDLQDALLSAFYLEEDLRAEHVFQFLRVGTISCISTPPAPRPEIRLPFPVECLEEFIRELKYQAFVTVKRFQFAHSRFMKRLPRHVAAEASLELFRIALREVFDAVSSSAVA